jgi:hypothetical protein
MKGKKPSNSASGMQSVSYTDTKSIFDPIPSDFRVTKVSDAGGNKFYAGFSGGLWHFVWANATVDETGNQFHHSINQAFIPRFLFAGELQRQLDFASSAKEEGTSVDHKSDQVRSDENQVFASEAIWGVFSVGVTKSDQIFLVHTEKGYVYPLGEASDWARNDLDLLRNARAKVLNEGDIFFLAAGKTHGGLPISYPSQRMIEAISFEREVYGKLDPVNFFELFSAFCTLVDSPFSRSFEEDYVKLLVDEQGSLLAEDAPVWLADLFMDLQDAVFDGHRIWGGDGTIHSTDAVLFVSEGLKKLSDVQRCQLVLLRDLHSPLPFISLAVVVGMLSFNTYADLLCEGLQPDSDQELAIRCQSAFIDLLGQI